MDTIASTSAMTPTTVPQPDIWSNNFWNPVNGLLNIGLFCFALIQLWLYLRSKKRKALTCQLISNTSVVNIDKSFEEKIRIQYDGIEVKTLQLIRLAIHNSGNIPILKEDFDEPLTFLPVHKKEYCSINFFASKGVRPTELISNERLGIEPLLINPKEWIIAEILYFDTNKKSVTVDVQGRLVGGTIEQHKTTPRRFSSDELWWSTAIPVVAFLLTSSILNFSSILSSFGSFKIPLWITISAPTSAMLITVVIITFSLFKKKEDAQP